jgi:peptidoglycan-N-acetylglucosamine deacetylase
MSLLIAISLALLVLLLVKIVFFVTFSLRHHRARKRDLPKSVRFDPVVSIVVPCYNEELVVENCVLSLQLQTYDRTEILLVDDGSSDGTSHLIRALAQEHENVRGFTKSNGGKASALNHGIHRAQGAIVVCMDADSMFLPDTVEQLVRSFDDPNVAAVGGNVRVANRDRAMGKHQAVEYISGLTIQRRAFSYLGCMQVISGAIGAFRKEALLAVGGYAEDTIVEDMDITVALGREGYHVVYNPEAIAYTEAPEQVGDFLKQRYRWTFGGFQVVAKHRDILFRRRYGRMGMIGLPYFAIFPWVDVIISLLLVAAVVRVAFTGDGLGLLLFYVLLTTLQASLVMYALVLDREDRRLTVMAAIESLFYAHLINFTTMRAGLNYLLGKRVKWNKLERLGKNSIAEVKLIREPEPVGRAA